MTLTRRNTTTVPSYNRHKTHAQTAFTATHEVRGMIQDLNGVRHAAVWKKGKNGKSFRIFPTTTTVGHLKTSLDADRRFMRELCRGDLFREILYASLKIDTSGLHLSCLTSARRGLRANP